MEVEAEEAALLASSPKISQSVDSAQWLAILEKFVVIDAASFAWTRWPVSRKSISLVWPWCGRPSERSILRHTAVRLYNYNEIRAYRILTECTRRMTLKSPTLTVTLGSVTR